MFILLTEHGFYRGFEENRNRWTPNYTMAQQYKTWGEANNEGRMVKFNGKGTVKGYSIVQIVTENPDY